MGVLNFLQASGGSRAGSGGSSNPPPPPPFLDNPMKMKYETKLFHFHGIFKKNEIKSAKLTPNPRNFIHMNPLSRNPESALAG